MISDSEFLFGIGIATLLSIFTLQLIHELWFTSKLNELGERVVELERRVKEVGE